MKTGLQAASPEAASIVRLATSDADSADTAGNSADLTGDASPLKRARSFAEPLLAERLLATGEAALAHADGVALILESIGAAPSLRAAAYLVYAGDVLSRPEEVIAKAFGASHASLVAGTRKLMQLQRAARDAQVGREHRARQTERVRKMLLAFSRDLRVVLLRLASRLQTLRWMAAAKQACDLDVAAESLQVFAPLANRLGIWQIKWEMEDLAFRFLEPENYKAVARWLDQKRVERERGMEAFRDELSRDLDACGLRAEVHGRPKHLYSIWKKMQGKALAFDRVFDVRAVRIIVPTVADCYAALGRVQERYTAEPGEFDDYIARPKANGYQSLHTVVRDAEGQAVEVQIRTQAMHDHAEHGVAAHWAYKEAGAKGYGGISADELEAQRAEARKAVLRQLLAWERDVVGQEASADAAGAAGDAAADDRIYVFTPQSTVVELTAGATPIDFAYAVHTDLGHRCRGAKVDGAMVPLNTSLQNGQTVEVSVIKEGGPSLDWLNAELGYLKSPRSRAKVRAWVNAQAQGQTIARGREAVEKLLQREGRTAIKLDVLASQLGFRNADALFEVVGKDEFSLRTIENLLHPPEPAPTADEQIALRRATPDAERPKGGVLVVGVESLMTSLARCCRPAPPDVIAGYVTRGKGVAVHRAACSNFRQMAQRAPERVIAVAWGAPRGDKPAVYPIDVLVQAADRQGLLRDISEVFTKEKMNVTGVNSQSVRDGSGATASMTFTIEALDSARLAHVLGLVQRISGVRLARRK